MSKLPRLLALLLSILVTLPLVVTARPAMPLLAAPDDPPPQAHPATPTPRVPPPQVDDPSARARPPQPTPTPSPATIGTDAMLFDSDRTTGGDTIVNFEIYTMKVSPQPDQRTLRRLTNDDAYDSWWARLSPDRTTILFHRTPRGVHDNDYTQVSLWLMAADGTGLRQLRAPGADGWAHQGHGEWAAPDGSQIAVFGGSATNPQIYLISASTGTIMQQVTDRPGVSLDPSWSARDPGNLLFIGCPEATCYPINYEIYRIAKTGLGATRLSTNAAHDQDPFLSRVGTRIAWIQEGDPALNGGRPFWDIWVMNADGSGSRNLTGPFNVPNKVSINSVPQWSWSPDDRWIYFHRVAEPANHFGLYRIAPSGTSPFTAVLVDDGWNNEYPAL